MQHALRAEDLRPSEKFVQVRGAQAFGEGWSIIRPFGVSGKNLFA